MRAALSVTAAAIATVVLALPAPALAGGPTRTQIARAIAKAEKSRSLWATINVCSVKRRGGEIGIRGQMPTLGFSSTLRMDIQLGSWSSTRKRFVAIDSSSAESSLSLGASSTGLQQKGTVFVYDSHPGLLDATITFSWTRGGKLLAQTTRRTTAGHRGVDYSKPAHYSAARCNL